MQVNDWHRVAIEVMSLSPGHHAVELQAWRSCSHPCASVTKQYNLVLAKVERKQAIYS